MADLNGSLKAQIAKAELALKAAETDVLVAQDALDQRHQELLGLERKARAALAASAPAVDLMGALRDSIRAIRSPQ